MDKRKGTVKSGAFGQKLKAFFTEVWNWLKSRFVHREEGHEGELFIERQRPRPFILSVLFTTLKLMAALAVAVGCVGLGLLMGVAKAYVETTPDLDVSQLTKSDRTSFIYDKDGDLITTFAGMEYRDWVDIEEVPDMLKNAVIAIEDVRFYKHEGLDYKRLFSAVVNTLRNADTHGGSTLTQQLVKNKILSNEQSYKRKIKEAYLAIEVEQLIEKDDILEAYLNDVYLGGSNYGVKTAAKDYFGKELSALSIRECAMLAGMVQRPYETNPRANTYSRFYDDGTNKMDITNKRTDTVINAMYDAGFITGDQCEAALADDVFILETSEQKQLYDMPYFVEYGIRDVVTHLLEQRGMLDTSANRTSVENELRTGGYSIHLTVDPDIQNTVQQTLSTWEEYPELADPSAAVKVTTNTDGTTIDVVEPQAAAVVFDYHTGELRAVVGGRDNPTRKKEWNRAYQSSTEVGSAIKPLSVYGPALDLGCFPGTVIANFEAPIEGWDSEKGYPAIGDEDYIGPVTIRRGVVSSLNVVAARTLLEKVGLQVSAGYLENLGVDSSRINVGGSGLALGTSGITPIEMAAAFGAIAAGGEYKEPLSFSRVLDASGKVILDANTVRKSRQVFKTSTAYMLVDMLTNAVKSGTGTRAKISDMTVAGKTGTNANYSSVYFAGITPYYSASVWIGHDDYANKLKKGATGGRYAAPLWQAFMSEIHEGLQDKPIIDESPTEIGLVKVTTCTVSGKLATEACNADPSGHLPVTDWVAKDSAPTELCDMHVVANVCTVSGEPASAYCPGSERRALVLINPTSIYAGLDPTMLVKYLTGIVYTDVTAAEYGLLGNETRTLCSLHTPSWIYDQEVSDIQLDTMISDANSLLTRVSAYLASVQDLSDTDRTTLDNGVYWLERMVEMRNAEQLKNYYDQLEYNYRVISAAHPPVGGTTDGGITDGGTTNGGTADGGIPDLLPN